MKIERSKLTTIFHTKHKQALKKLLFKMGLVKSPNYNYKIGPTSKHYKINICLTDKQVYFIRENFRPNSKTKIVVGFTGNLITGFSYEFRRAKKISI